MFILPTGPMQGMHDHTDLTVRMRQAQTMTNAAPFSSITILILVATEVYILMFGGKHSFPLSSLFKTDETLSSQS